MKKTLATFLILLSLQWSSFAGEQFHFIHYNKEVSGLCHDGIRTLLQDSNGYLWIGTYNGLARFDGRQFKSFYRKDFGISSDFICSLCEGTDHNLWIGTDEGLVRYCHKNSGFKAMKGQGPSSRVYSLARDHEGTIWVGSKNDGLWRIDSPRNRCEQVCVQDTDGNPITSIYRIASDRRGNIYFCSYCDDLYCYSEDGNCSPVIEGFFHHDDIEGIACGPTGSTTLYVASKRNGLCAVNTENGEVNVLSTLPSDQRPVNLMYKGKYLYMSTTGGLIRYDLMNMKIGRICSSDSDIFSLSDNFVTDACIDNNGGLWVATSYDGLNYSSPMMNNFERFYCTSDGSSLSGAIVCGFSKSSDGTVWIATENKGLMQFNPDTRELRPAEIKGLPNTIMALCMDGDYLWIGFHGGLCRFDTISSEVRYYSDIFGNLSGSPDNNYDNRVVSIFNSNDSKRRLYVSTTIGVATYDPSNDGFEPVRCMKGVTVEDMKMDASGLIWMASYSQGVYAYNPATDNLKEHFFGPSDDSGIPEMNSYICMDKDGSVWVISFNGGFFRYNPETSTFKHFDRTVIDDIDTDIMLSGLFDQKGRLWISSDDGLILFNPSTESSTSFTIADGLLDNQFKKAALMLDDGRMLMGNKDGFIMYEPSMIDSSNKALRVASEPYDVLLYVKIRKVLTITFISIAIVLAAVFVMFLILHRRAIKRQSKLHEDSKQAMKEELYHEKMSFFASVVHEIKTPLTLIRTPLQNLLDSKKINGEEREDLALIDNNTNYLDKLVRELLEFISVEEHGYVLDFRNIDLIERIGFICSNYLESAKARKLDFTFSHPDESLVCALDSKMLLKIVNNLLHNALKYAQTYIQVDVHSENQMVLISVRNDGEIISDEKRDIIFNPFVHFAPSEDTTQSFGIGLPLARKLTELHGGSLILTENRDCNEFVASLPLRIVDEKQEDTTDSEDMTSEKSGLPILLIVEDNADLLRYLKRKLSSDYITLGAQTAEKALEKLSKHKVDLLITDIGLPSMSGDELCAKVNSNSETAHIPVIILSAISDVKTKIKCMDAGASMYIEKPFSLDYLQTCIASVMAKRKSMKSAYSGTDSALSRIQLDLPDRDDDFVRRLDKLVTDNISDPNFTNRQIEEALFVSRSSLNRKMKLLLGTTANDYIRKKRLEVAAQMLSRGGARVNEICFAVGFNSPSYFAKCFREVYGKLPTEYAKDA